MGLLAEAPTYVDRFGKSGRILASAWLVAVIVYSFGALQAQFVYAANADDRLAWAAPATLVVAALSAIFWAWFRQRGPRGVWRYEPHVIAALAVAICLVQEPLATLVVVLIFVAAFSLGGAVLRGFGFERTWVRGSGDPVHASSPQQSESSRTVLSRVPLSVTLLRTGTNATFRSPIEEVVFSAGAGVGLITTGLFLIGLGGQLTPLVLGISLVVTLIVCRRQIRSLIDCLSQMGRLWTHCESLRHPLIGLTVPFLALLSIFTLAASLAPSIAIDAMRNHLPDAARFLDSGDLSAASFSRYAYHPKAHELLLTLAWALGDEPAAQLVNPGLFLLALLAVFSVGRACGLARADAVFGVIVVAAIPFLHWTGSVVKNDLHVTFLQLGSLLAYFRSRREDERRWLLLGVFLLASSFGVKHTGVFVALPIGLLYLLAAWRRPRLLAQLALVALLFGAHWHALTFARTGNPVYPWGASSLKQWPALGTITRPPLLEVYAKYPWLSHFQGGVVFQSPTPNPLGLFLALFCPLWLLTRRTKRTFELECVFVCALCYLLWGYIWGVLRYAIPAVILLVLLITARLSGYLDRGSRGFRGLSLGALLYGFCFALLPTVFIELNFPQIRYFSGEVDRNGYLDEAVRFMPSIRYLNSVWEPGDAVVSVGNPAVVHSPDSSRFFFVTDSARQFERVRAQLAEPQLEYRYLLGPIETRSQLLEVFDAAHVVHSDNLYFVAKRD